MGARMVLPMCPRVEYDVEMLAALVAMGLASGSAGAVRVPSSDGAWGGVRDVGPERVADYELEAVLDPLRHTVEGKERLSWKNRSAEAVSSLYLHLYLNAFEGPGSTFAQEKVRYGGFRSDVPTRKGEWGYIDLKRVTQAGTPVPWVFVHPDGGPATDRTVARLDLPRPVPPGATEVLEHGVPRSAAARGGAHRLVRHLPPGRAVVPQAGRARTARRARRYGAPLELPRVPPQQRVLRRLRQLRAEHHRAARVRGRRRRAREIARAGTRRAQGIRHRDRAGRRARLRLHGLERLSGAGRLRGQGGGGPDVHIKVLYPPEYDEGGAHRAPGDASTPRRTSPRTLGPYPVQQVTVVVPPYNAIESGGMEYETFFTTIGGARPAVSSTWSASSPCTSSATATSWGCSPPTSSRSRSSTRA